ncbi:MAG: SprT family zinc-dependent metalloprotease [Tenuifilaceae bacterium]|nr:SprT family zinc-dependent metalloprotease [Tenuifilaceae bacterium]
MPPLKRKPSTLWHLPGVGDILLRHNPRAKRLSLSVHPQKGVRVTIPTFLPVATAQQFVEQKRNWIIEKQNQLAQRSANNIIESGFKTRHHELLLIPSEVNDTNVTILNGKVTVAYPYQQSISSNEVQSTVRTVIEQLYRKESLSYLPQRVNALAQQFGFSYNTLRVKNIKSRWGSCSSTNNINLSIYLMKLPDELIDYIILHELTHTVHKNHGPNFWKHLNRITGNAKGLNQRMKKYSTGV